MVIYEDDYIIGVNKPNNLLVHHSSMARNVAEEKTLVELLRGEYLYPVYPIHRLDRKTSGIILFAKKKEYVADIQHLFNINAIQKTYYGIVRGFIGDEGVIDSPVKGRDANVYKEALTHFKCINQVTIPVAVQPYDSSRYSLVKLLPKTGRLHQLRIHLNKINHPLIGDPKYGDRFHNRMFEQEFDCRNLFLHAHQLEFTHPFHKEDISIVGDFPQDWCNIATHFQWSLP